MLSRCLDFVMIERETHIRAFRPTRWLAMLAGLVGLLLLMPTSPATAQLLNGNNFHQPLNQRVIPGVAGTWSLILGKAGRSPQGYFQPVRVELPDTGKVTFFDASPNRPLAMRAPAQAALAVGHTYRLKVSHMPEFPGIELFPSIELLDRLHPPSGRKDEFPIPVELTRDEIQFALDGRMVTKVVYLEQPQFAVPLPREDALAPLTIAAYRNLLAEADHRGRPMIIVRLGGRLPSVHGNDPDFFGSGAPIMVSKPKVKSKSELKQKPTKQDGQTE